MADPSEAIYLIIVSFFVYYALFHLFLSLTSAQFLAVRQETLCRRTFGASLCRQSYDLTIHSPPNPSLARHKLLSYVKVLHTITNNAPTILNQAINKRLLVLT